MIKAYLIFLHILTYEQSKGQRWRIIFHEEIIKNLGRSSKNIKKRCSPALPPSVPFVPLVMNGPGSSPPLVRPLRGTFVWIPLLTTYLFL